MVIQVNVIMEDSKENKTLTISLSKMLYIKTLGPRREAKPLVSGGSGRLYRVGLVARAVEPLNYLFPFPTGEATSAEVAPTPVG